MEQDIDTVLPDLTARPSEEMFPIHFTGDERLPRQLFHEMLSRSPIENDLVPHKARTYLKGVACTLATLEHLSSINEYWIKYGPAATKILDMATTS